MGDDVDIVRFFDGHPGALALFRRIEAVVAGIGPADVRVSRSQVAFRRQTGFAFVWLPGRWLRHPAAETVLSLALGRRDPSPRWKEVVHPSPRIWMHHLELRGDADIDDEVRDWLREAYDQAG